MATGLKALLVAAGVGSRLRPLTDVLPKCLMPINGQPLLGLWLERVAAAGTTDIVVNLHHHAALVRAYVERSPYAGAVVLSPEETLLGTAGTLMRHRDQLSGAPILFAHADNLSVFDLERFLAAHKARPSGALVTMMTFTAETPELCGIVTLDARGRIASFDEKPRQPKGNMANAAVFLIDPELFGVIDAFGRLVFEFSTDVLPHILDRVHTFHNDVYHRDIGTLPSLCRAQLDYFCLERGRDPARVAQDPWYGMMTENGGRLAQDFARVVDAAFRAAG